MRARGSPLTRTTSTLVVAVTVALVVPSGARADDDVTVRGSQSAGFSSRAREKDSAREITDAASLVEPLPGVHVRRFGADDAFATLSIRGSSSSQVAVMLAGVPLTGGADPSLDLASLPLWPGSQARVYRSFTPANVGSGSLGGTLVLDPPRVGAPVGTEVWGAVSSYGGRRVRIGDVRAVPFAGESARVVTALSASRSDDDFTYYDPKSDSIATRDNAGHAAIHGLTSWSVPVTWGEANVGALTVTALAQARRQRLPGSIAFPTLHQELESNRELGALELTGHAGPGLWIARGWARREGLRLSDAPADAKRAGNPWHTADAIVGAGTSLGWRGHPLAALVVEGIVDASGERFAPGTYEGGEQPPAATRSRGGAGIDADFSATDDVTFSGSGRLDAWRDVSDVPSDSRASSAAALPSPSQGELRPTGHVGTEARVGPVTLATHGGYVARAPSFVERYGNRGAFIGDPSLVPESAYTLDAGARIARKFGALAIEAELAGFATWADNLIVYVHQGATGRAKATNIGHAGLVGAEGELRASAFGLEMRASYTALVTENRAECTSAFGTCERPPLPGRPAHDFVGDVTYGLGPVHVRYGVDALAGMTTDLKGEIGVPARILQSAGARFDVPGTHAHAHGLRLALDVRNLFDVRIATYAGALGPTPFPIGDLYEYPLPGRTVLVSARFDSE
jgi:vitamin B12 transporter